MSLETFFQFSQWFFLTYFTLLTSCYLMLNFNAILSIARYMGKHSLADFPGGESDVMPPISLIVPAFNEETTIIKIGRAHV